MANVVLFYVFEDVNTAEYRMPLPEVVYHLFLLFLLILVVCSLVGCVITYFQYQFFSQFCIFHALVTKIGGDVLDNTSLCQSDHPFIHSVCCRKGTSCPVDITYFLNVINLL